MLRSLHTLVLLAVAAMLLCGQEKDSLTSTPFSAPEAWLFIEEAVGDGQLWKESDSDIRASLERLLEHTQSPYDSARHTLESFDIAGVSVHTGEPVLFHSQEVNWLNDSMFIIDPQGWNSELYLKEERELVYPVDLSTLSLSDSILDDQGMLDSTLFIPDTVVSMLVDTAALRALEISLHYFREDSLAPPIPLEDERHSARLSADRQKVEYYVPGDTWKAEAPSPFHILTGEYQLDSLQAAVNTLLEFNKQRDSTRILINDNYGRKTPFWITNGHEDSYRFWVKNYQNDSITLWIGNPGSGEISLIMEDDVNFSRMSREEISHLHAFIVEPKRELQKMTMLEPTPRYWSYAYSAALSLSQTFVSRSWTKGGESSFSSMIDMTGKATYNNKKDKTQWINSARLKFGTLWTENKNGIRKNHDQFEVESKYNRNAWGKIGLSASFYMKNQLAPGRKYFDNDSSTVVSKFLNPGTLTLGLGAEYKPLEKTTINLAPISYKTTFVFDTAHIDQTTHGIDADKWARRELGFQVVISNQIKPFKGLTLTNQARLFSNYLNKPQNIDVDWEIIAEQKINWFFTIRLNLHFIYDDDVHTTVYENGEAVILPDGTEKKSPQLQFKEFVGLALNFKF